MKCLKCGESNAQNAKFCASCGAELIKKEKNETKVKEETKDNINKKVVEKNNKKVDIMANIKDCLNYLKKLVIKPKENYKEHKNKLNNLVTASVLTGLVSLAMVIINLIKNMIAISKVTNYSWEGTTTSWEFSRISELNFLELIFKNFLIYALVILAIAVVYYIASLIIKNELNINESIIISCSSIVPIVIGTMVLAPILGLIWGHLSVIVSVASSIYGITILYELINDEIKLKDDKKIYFNVICFAILIIAVYFIGINMVSNALTDLGSLLG